MYSNLNAALFALALLVAVIVLVAMFVRAHRKLNPDTRPMPLAIPHRGNLGAFAHAVRVHARAMWGGA